MDWKGKTALVTGGCGLIGSTIVDQLVQAGIGRVIILDNLTRGTLLNVEWALENGPVELVHVDIRDFDGIRPHFEGVDVVFHQAAIRITACAERWRECQEVLVDGTYNVVEASVQAGVERFVAASSASVYGAADVFPTPERHHPFNNRTLYGAAKIANEACYRAFHEMSGFPYVALRYFNVYGPRMDVFGQYTEVLVRWLDALDEGVPPRIFGDGRQTMDWVFVEDVARANVLAAESDLCDEVFNIASGVETSLRDLLDLLLRITGREDVKPEFLPQRKVNPVPRRLADVEKAHRLLGFNSQIGLEEGLRRLLEWRQDIIDHHLLEHYDPHHETGVRA
jgi:UDP-glucose 4-epimerase